MNDMNCLRVLYVEDDDATREAFSKFLRLRTGKLFAAATGEEGLRKFQDHRPNLLIVDLIMPGMSGLEMISEIRKTDPDCRILITSSVNELNTVLEAVDLGIDHYIVKPIDTEDLERKMIGIAKGIMNREEKSRIVNFAKLENSGSMEDAIRREFLKLMKTYSGKGPQDVKVLLYENQIEITAIDAVTLLEKTIMANKKNLSMAEQYRKLYYEEISRQLEESAEQSTGYRVKVSSIQSDAMKKVDRIVLTAL
jgi:YesN/AraC family two-component response regulator